MSVTSNRLARDRAEARRPRRISAQGTARLPKTAHAVDHELCRIDTTMNWLQALSPVDNDALWRTFEANGLRNCPKLRYRPLDFDPRALRQRIDEIPIGDVEDPILEALFAEKQKELSLFTVLLELRDTSGALAASLELFGGTEPRIQNIAERILKEVYSDLPAEEQCGCDVLVSSARTMIETYRQNHPDFEAEVVVRDDLNGNLMVSGHRLFVARTTRVPFSRVAPLLAHEVGTHLLTHYNGLQQSPRILACGLAGYDELQEGLAAFSEFLAGNLPARRLRTLAARVVAARLAVEEKPLQEIFDTLHEEYRMLPSDAFEVAVRALRGGGLTKDAVYLRGLDELLEYLKAGGCLEKLHLGKFALSQLPLLEKLEAKGWIQAPRMLPLHLSGLHFEERLNSALRRDVFQFCSN